MRQQGCRRWSRRPRRQPTRAAGPTRERKFCRCWARGHEPSRCRGHERKSPFNGSGGQAANGWREAGAAWFGARPGGPGVARPARPDRAGGPCRAGTDAERLVKLGSIRAELQTGRRQGRYESKDGRWSLAASPSAEGDGASDASASSEPDGPAGAPADASRSEAGPSPEMGETRGVLDGDAPGEDAASGEPDTGDAQSRLGMNW